MSETRNYGLYVEDDGATSFRNWRQKMNGGNSYNCNMTKIDEILHGKADQSTQINLVLTAGGWRENDSGCYEQVLEVAGLTAEQNGDIGVAHSATAAERAAARAAYISLINQEDGKLTVTADGKLPTINIPVTVVLMW